MKCPNCGAEIGANSKFCGSCGSQITYEMRREQEQVNKIGCPKCGSSSVEFRRENQGEVQGKSARQIIYRTVGFCKDCGYTWYTSDVSNDVPKKSNMIWWVLGWIFFFPAPVMVLIWRKKNTWDIKVKIAVTIAFWILLFVIGSTKKSGDTSTPSETTSNIEETRFEDQVNEMVSVDYGDAESFEAALNAGDNLEGRVVRFKALEQADNKDKFD